MESATRSWKNRGSELTLPLSVDLGEESTGVSSVGDGSGSWSEREGLSDLDGELFVDLSEERTGKSAKQPKLR